MAEGPSRSVDMERGSGMERRQIVCPRGHVTNSPPTMS
ncbi:hypothetical protein NXF25_012800 [Crotalus adamanteus]|uniref:Uncharacterized protein n=1 Tax=Crotalus adamanteus TaxID=8729 RepID=A0AAW1BC26_CROAD